MAQNGFLVRGDRRNGGKSTLCRQQHEFITATDEVRAGWRIWLIISRIEGLVGARIQVELVTLLIIQNEVARFSVGVVIRTVAVLGMHEGRILRFSGVNPHNLSRGQHRQITAGPVNADFVGLSVMVKRGVRQADALQADIVRADVFDVGELGEQLGRIVMMLGDGGTERFGLGPDYF